MLKLGVNIDHVATLRQARYARMPHAHNVEPSLLEAARECEAAGAHSITIHLREDRRHIQDADVHLLRRELRIPLNLELGNTEEIVAIACAVRPDYVCMVPENRLEITTEGGLDAVAQRAHLAPTIKRLQASGIRVSLFIEPSPDQIEMARELGAEIIELHTGAFANAQGEEQQGEFRRLRSAADFAFGLGLQVNAGHGINYTNIARIRTLTHVAELNIGHSIISRAILIGLDRAVAEMLELMRG